MQRCQLIRLCEFLGVSCLWKASWGAFPRETTRSEGKREEIELMFLLVATHGASTPIVIGCTRVDGRGSSVEDAPRWCLFDHMLCIQLKRNSAIRLLYEGKSTESVSLLASMKRRREIQPLNVGKCTSEMDYHVRPSLGAAHYENIRRAERSDIFALV